MVNCNPETVSTDFDISDRLYFEPLDIESVLQICRSENLNNNLLGVIVQLGGQTPLKLSENYIKRVLKFWVHHLNQLIYARIEIGFLIL